MRIVLLSWARGDDYVMKWMVKDYLQFLRRTRFVCAGPELGSSAQHADPFFVLRKRGNARCWLLRICVTPQLTPADSPLLDLPLDFGTNFVLG